MTIGLVSDYRYQGLRLRSFMPLQALQGSELPEDLLAPCDLIVYPGLPELPDGLRPAANTWAVVDGAFAFGIPDIGPIVVLNGRDVYTSICREDRNRLLEQFILGLGFAVAQMQRRHFCLHGAVLSNGSRAIAFCGNSGEGKSTLALAMSMAGWEALTDDLTLVNARNHSIVVESNGRHLRLHGQALTTLGYSTTGLTQISPHEDKYYIRAPHEAIQSGVRLDAICFLESGTDIREFAISPISGMPALAALRQHTYRSELISDLGCDGPHLAHCIKIVSSVPLYRFQRPRDLLRLGEMVSFVDRELGFGGDGE